MATREDVVRAYLVCRERGHQPSNITTSSIPPQNVCKFCGTYYRFSEPQLIEGIGKPTEDEINAVRGIKPEKPTLNVEDLTVDVVKVVGSGNSLSTNLTCEYPNCGWTRLVSTFYAEDSAIEHWKTHF